jgi:hypothetical protein
LNFFFSHVILTSRTLVTIPKFSFILDKGTLDGVLCESLEATIGLLSLAYQSLQEGGWYIVISFHESELLTPLLQDLPGAVGNTSKN